jgi:hypothetical protein
MAQEAVRESPRFFLVRESALGFTKIDVAEAHIRTAVRLFFEDAHPVPVHTLACAAREILTALGEKLGIDTILHEAARLTGTSVRDVKGKAHTFANFMKHADRDPTATLEGFSDADNGPVLFFACHDFGRVTGGMPVEAQVFEAWFFATTVKRVSDGGVRWQRLVKDSIKLFPRVRSVPRAEKKQIGARVLARAMNDPALRMEFKRTVELPAKQDTAKGTAE